MHCQKIREEREFLKAKKIRIIATSFLLFQQALLPSVVMAIENESIANTELMEEQPESHLSEATTEVVEEQEQMIHEEQPESYLSETTTEVVEEQMIHEELPRSTERT